MFSRTDFIFFAASITLLITGFLFMAFDPAPNGFGALTLWIAPPILLTGFIIPVLGILGISTITRTRIKLNTLKHLCGFAVLVVSFSTYLFTLEPTASLWDCSEFIASAYKLQVPHTPGTPLSLLVGRMFTMLAGNDVHRVAWTLNAMSAFFSSLSVYALYHLVLYFCKRIELVIASEKKTISVAAAICGSLAFAFSDTFWFSAVEAETYGIACFFLVLLIMMILKGPQLSEPFRSRWLILIFYIGGLSYCIHPMCVLALPLLPFVWFTAKRSVTPWNTLLSVAGGLVLVLAINRLIGIGTFELAFAFDYYFVNSLHLPFYSGAVVFVVAITGACIYLVKKFAHVQRYTWSFIFLVLGFTPYLMLFIRSNQNPPIDENNPENLAMIKAYMNRESYPSSPLHYGPYYDAKIEDFKIKKNIYHQSAGRYEFSGSMVEYGYDPSRSTILPRLHSNDPAHIEAYRQWLGKSATDLPTFIDNMYFMLSYQLGHMYSRYLLFNFSGRESDEQNASWLTPFATFNAAGNTAYISKARNQYWMLPLLLGFTGLIGQARKDIKGTFVVALFFLITGAILALYLNSPPVEPRERDYIYIGSFMAFSIWIGLGIISLYNAIQKRWIRIPVIALSIAIPLLLLWQNFDDHDRSGRTFQIDNARNLLSSCAPDAILFTGGDNDTFPLWYLQEVEGVRTDVRVVVLSYLNTDWYINQLRKSYYNSASFNLTLNQDDYLQYGPNDVLYVQESIKKGIDLKKFLLMLKDDNSPLRTRSNTGDPYTILPSRLLTLKIDPKKFKSDILAALPVEQASEIPPSEITFHVSGNFLQKNALAILDLLTSNDWNRPVYFNYTALNTSGLDLNSHVIQEGNVYRLSPVRPEGDYIALDTDLMFKNLIDQADYSNLSDEKIYFNYEDFHSKMIIPARQSLNTLAAAYLQSTNFEMAEKVLDFSLDNLYPTHLLPSYTNLQTAEMLVAMDREKDAIGLSLALFNYHYGKIRNHSDVGAEISRMDVVLAQEAANILAKSGRSEYEKLLVKAGLSQNPVKKPKLL